MKYCGAGMKLMRFFRQLQGKNTLLNRCHESLLINPTKIEDFQPITELMQCISIFTRKELSANQCEWFIFQCIKNQERTQTQN